MSGRTMRIFSWFEGLLWRCTSVIENNIFANRYAGFSNLMSLINNFNQNLLTSEPNLVELLSFKENKPGPAWKFIEIVKFN